MLKTALKNSFWVKNKKTNYLLLLILLLSAFFRFYNFSKLQFFTCDDGLVFTIIRKMIIERRPVLISPNEATGLTLGSFLHIISLPFFIIAKGSPVIMGIFSSFLGMLTTFLVFRTGRLFNKKVGLLASFIYACSFLIALFDRRYWALTPNSFLATLAFLSLYKIIIQKDKSWIYPFCFVFSSMFSWHSDLSVLIIPLAGIISWLIFKPKLLNRKNAPAFLLLLFSIAPLVFFEFRHNFVNFKALKNVSAIIGEKTSSYSFSPINSRLFSETTARILFVSADKIKNNFYYNQYAYLKPKHPFLAGIIISFTLAVFIKLWFKSKNEERKGLSLLAVFFLAFFLGYLIYVSLFKGSFSQHYFTVIFPIVCLFFAIGLNFLLKTKLKFLAYLFLIIFLLTNLQVLFQAEIKYPTKEKIKAIGMMKSYLKDKKFAAYDYGFPGAGMNYLYLYNDLHPVKCATFDGWYWVYMSNGLFDITPQVEWPDKVVVMTPGNYKIQHEENIIVQKQYGDIKLTLLNNSKQWVNKEKLDKFKQSP